MNKAEYYKANVGLVHTVSRKGYTRLLAARVTIDYEDVFQEMSIVFLKAYEKFDASLGFQFSTFFYRAAFNRLNNWAQDLIDDRLRYSNIEDMGSEEANDLESVLWQDHDTPEGHYAVNQMIEHIAKSLSPLASLIFTWSLAPPPEINQEIRKAQINAEFGRSLGYDTRCMAQLTPRYVANFVRLISDASQYEINKALKEIDKLKYSDLKNMGA
jgi:hypothetical protein